MNKEEMINVLAELAITTKVLEYISINNIDKAVKYLSLCDEIDTDIECLIGSTDTHISEIIYDGFSKVTDEELTTCIFKITRIKNRTEGYLRFKGRYSSWDSSYYNSCDVVYPRKIEKIVFETKLERGE